MLVIVGGKIEDWGIIPTFLHSDDPRSVKEQFNARYIAGWEPFDGFTWDRETGVLSYEGDPPMKPLSSALFRNEVIVLYPYAWVLVAQPDAEWVWEICRMD